MSIVQSNFAQLIWRWQKFCKPHRYRKDKMPIQSHNIRSGQSEGHSMYSKADDAEFVHQNHEWMKMNAFLGLTTWAWRGKIYRGFMSDNPLSQCSLSRPWDLTLQDPMLTNLWPSAYFAFLMSVEVRNSASSLMKLHQRYVSGMVLACHREWASA